MDANEKFVEANKIKKIYFSNFDAQTYHQHYYTKLDPEIKFMLENNYKAFSKLVEEGILNKESQLLEYGCGPTPIYIGGAVAAGFPGQISLREMLPSNREAFESWVADREGCLNWDHFFHFFEGLSNKRWDEIIHSCRSQIKAIEPTDLTLDLSSEITERFDVVLSQYCLECSTSSLEDYIQFFVKLSQLVSGNGLLIIGGGLETKYYMMGEKKLTSMPLKVEDLQNAVKASNFEIVDLKLMERAAEFGQLLDNNGAFFLVAKRKK